MNGSDPVCVVVAAVVGLTLELGPVLGVVLELGPEWRDEVTLFTPV